MRRMGVLRASIAIGLLLLVCAPMITSPPDRLPRFEASGEFDETANNLIRIGFETVSNGSLYEVHAATNFTNLDERDANLLANGFAGFADAWVRVTDEVGDPANDPFRAAELMRCWWSDAGSPVLDLQDVESNPAWTESTYTTDQATYAYPDFEGTPHVPVPRASSVNSLAWHGAKRSGSR